MASWNHFLIGLEVRTRTYGRIDGHLEPFCKVVGRSDELMPVRLMSSQASFSDGFNCQSLVQWTTEAPAWRRQTD